MVLRKLEKLHNLVRDNMLFIEKLKTLVVAILLRFFVMLSRLYFRTAVSIEI